MNKETKDNLLSMSDSSFFEMLNAELSAARLNQIKNIISDSELFNKLSNLDEEKIFTIFSWLNYYGKTELIKKILDTELSEKININNNNGYCLTIACERDFIDLVEFYTTSSDLKQLADPRLDHHHALGTAIYHGHIDVVKFLFEKIPTYKPELLTEHIRLECAFDNKNSLEIITYLIEEQKLDYMFNNNALFKQAIANSKTKPKEENFKIINYLFNRPELKQYLIENPEQCPFNEACSYSYPTLQLMLSEKSIEKEFLQTICFDDYFKSACTEHNDEVIKYFLFDLNIDIDQNMKNWLKGENKKREKHNNVLKLLNKRDLFLSLKNDLPENKEEHFNQKI